MPQKVSRSKRRYLSKGRKRFLEEKIELPIEIWRIIFLLVRKTTSLKNVNEQFRATIQDPYFEEQYSKNWGLCKLAGCKTPSGKTRNDCIVPESDYCYRHTCGGCHVGSRKYPCVFCIDCQYTCVHEGCEEVAIRTKSYIEWDRNYGYCGDHGCSECGLFCPHSCCSGCAALLYSSYEDLQYPIY